MHSLIFINKHINIMVKWFYIIESWDKKNNSHTNILNKFNVL